jgi:hypothetical protein
MKRRYSVLILLIALIVFWALIANTQKYEYPEGSDLRLKVNYLARVINTPFPGIPEFNDLQQKNPEWLLFSLSFSTYALTNVTFLDTLYRSEAVQLIDHAIQKVLSDTVYSYYFPYKKPFNPLPDSSGSILYYGHLNMMLGCYRLLTNNPKYNELNNRLSACLYKRYSHSSSLLLESYPGKIWIPDNTAALASLALHSENTKSEYREICTEWIKLAREQYSEKETGLLCSAIDAQTGKAMEEPRGSMIGWSIFFIYRFDKEYAKTLYERYMHHFSTNLSVYRLYKERRGSFTTGSGDIDSGPMVLGYSLPANAFAFGGAVAMQDFKNAVRLQRVIGLGAKKVVENNEMRYQTRFFDMPVSPLAEALLLSCETMTDWEKKK